MKVLRLLRSSADFLVIVRSFALPTACVWRWVGLYSVQINNGLEVLCQLTFGQCTNDFADSLADGSRGNTMGR